MPNSDESRDEALSSLDKRLEALEAGRARKMDPSVHLAMGQGYRFLGEVVGGVLGGAGFGWLLDRFTGTTPWGLIGGLLIGTGLSMFYAVKNATSMTKIQTEKLGPLPSVTDDEDED